MYLFPEVTVQIVNTLYILGNGFDLYHNLKTRYVDFKQFASVLQTLEPFFCLDELWCNFEEALAQVSRGKSCNGCWGRAEAFELWTLCPTDFDFSEGGFS